jgi:hypothetical protein
VVPYYSFAWSKNWALEWTGFRFWEPENPRKNLKIFSKTCKFSERCDNKYGIKATILIRGMEFIDQNDFSGEI